MKILIILMASCLLMSCAGIKRADMELLSEIEECGYDNREHGEIEAPMAGALNVLPGIGNFYLAAKSDEDYMWLIGILNLVSWPYSIIWAVPEAIIDAKTINKKETIKYYRFSKEGKRKLRKCRGESEDIPPIDQDEVKEVKKVKVYTEKEVIVKEKSYFEAEKE